jgi:glycosyltransferase involved in cell wall biosynthesis
VITVSEASARDIVQHLHVPQERIHVVYHGPNQEALIRPDADELAAIRTRYQLPARFFLYLGGYDVRKNVSAILHGYQTYLNRGGNPAVRLVLAGKLPTADTPFTPDPRALAQALGLMNQVHFYDWIPEADKPALYALATAFIFPSLYEGFGMMILEAMQAGAPVLTSAECRVRSAERDGA